MVAYACRFEPAPPGHVVTCRDLPVVTWGETLPEGMAMAADAIATVLSDMPPGDWPKPSPAQPGEVVVTLLPLLAAKTALWSAMVDAGVSRSELARRLGCDEKEVRRLLSFKHRSQIDRVATALACLGKRLVVDLEDAA
ncbi:MAG: antitoxin [Geminicoccaceae bacterium]|jgi:antitoxin HicB|nr:antitoxin [Geminicoccaceae bacterium]